MGDWPAGDAQRAVFNASSVVTPSASANTFGSWYEQISSIPWDVALWDVHSFENNTVDGILELGLGGAGSEVTIVSLPVYQGAVATAPNHTLPLRLPAGQRLSARCKFNTTSAQDLYPDIHLFAGQSFTDQTVRQRATTYGITNSSGVAVSSGATSGVGSWTQITASTTNRIKQMLVCFQPNTVAATDDVLLWVDVGVGAAASEVVVFEKLYTYYQVTGGTRFPFPNATFPLPCNIPAGSRIAVRTQAPNNTGTHIMNVSVIGVD